MCVWVWVSVAHLVGAQGNFSAAARAAAHVAVVADVADPRRRTWSSGRSHRLRPGRPRRSSAARCAPAISSPPAPAPRSAFVWKF